MVYVYILQDTPLPRNNLQGTKGITVKINHVFNQSNPTNTWRRRIGHFISYQTEYCRKYHVWMHNQRNLIFYTVQIKRWELILLTLEAWKICMFFFHVLSYPVLLENKKAQRSSAKNKHLKSSCRSAKTSSESTSTVNCLGVGGVVSSQPLPREKKRCNSFKCGVATASLIKIKKRIN